MRDRTGTAFGARAHNESDIITTDTSGRLPDDTTHPDKRIPLCSLEEENGRSRKRDWKKKSIYRNGRRVERRKCTRNVHERRNDVTSRVN